MNIKDVINGPKMNNDAISTDTSAQAERVQLDILRKIGITGRAQMTFQLSNNLRAVTEAGIRQRHPDYDDQMVKLAVIRLTVGDKLFRQAFGDVEVET